MAAIAVHGFINVDLAGKTAAFAGADQEAELEEFQVFSGGSAANVAVGLSRLGQEVFFLGATGDDGYASLLIKELEQVRCDYIQQVPGVVSGTVMITVDRQGLRTMYTYPGANTHFNWRLVPQLFVGGLDYLHLSSPADAVIEQLVQLKEANSGLQVSLDPSKLLTGKGLRYLKPLLQQTSILFLNEAELDDLFPSCQRSEGIRQLHSIGPKHIFVKLGAKGAEYSFMQESGQPNRMHQGAQPVHAVDSTGAGDAFAAGALYGLARGWEQQNVLRLGIEMGTRAVAAVGARTGLPYRHELSGLNWFS
ncbi:carbohydrate kinase family protein [Paenibacillus gorillae]|uniref:carbohydrate kinase family protein n=1 Tax=Paenibacillus gorillae TaxID=1243662 RepID=UPI0004AE4458|nr:carbohydrate kinase family protein [Paenibacillus gorillae]